MNIKELKSPKDIKNFNLKELEKFSSDMREFLINSISETGGHLGSSLGALDLIVALHYTFDSPKDKLIFDIGHQAYAHKLLTGRAKEFQNLRKKDGLSGFLKREESVHDVWESGHSSTSISAAVGYALQRDLDNGKNHVVAVIGDGSLTNGMSFEALNHISELNQKVIIIINDNEMSISNNVGFVDKILKNLENASSYDKTKKVVRHSLDKIDSSHTLSKLISASKTKIKNGINSSKTFFNLLGFKYFGLVDGHDFKDLLDNLNEAKKINGPVIIHVKTQKGKGYDHAMENKWHAIGPFDIKTGLEKAKKTHFSNSDLIAKELLNIMEKDEDVVIVSPAMFKGSSLEKIEAKFQKRITDVGIAEEHGTTLVAALALAGKKPFLSIYSTFLQRSYDQVLHDIVRQNCGVVIGIDRAGLVGADGETHQGIYDISFLMHMPNLIIVQGRNAREMKGLLNLGFSLNRPYALRYSRGGKFDDKELNIEFDKIKVGSWETMKQAKQNTSEKINILSYGENINEIFEYFSSDDEVGIINTRFIKPLDEEKLLEIKDSKILIVEEHIRLGGIGTMILDFYNRRDITACVKILAIDDHFVEQGTVKELREQENIDLEAVKLEVGKLKKC